MANRKEQYGKHKRGMVPLTIWVEKEYKEVLKAEANLVKKHGHPWSLSDHVRFLLDDSRGLWDKAYRPYPKR